MNPMRILGGEVSAFGAPGIEPRWTRSAKEGIGTAYHTSCRVWFTLSHGIINEIYYPNVDSPNTRDLQLWKGSDRRSVRVKLDPRCWDPVCHSSSQMAS